MKEKIEKLITARDLIIEAVGYTSEAEGLQLQIDELVDTLPKVDIDNSDIDRLMARMG